jgi:two-component system sporulation sensor kinase A
MPSRIHSTRAYLAIGLLMLAGFAWPMAVVLEQDLTQRLKLNNLERAGLAGLADLRAQLRSPAEILLSGASVNAVQAQQWVEQARGARDRAKRLGYDSALILDPQLDIYHLAYLSTVKLPERAAMTVELAALEHDGLLDLPRARFLRQSLAEQNLEESRALGVALDSDQGVESQTLRDEDRQRQDRLSDYALGRRARLRDLMQEDLRFWELCDQTLERALAARDNRLRLDQGRRLMLLAALLALLGLGGWRLIRGLADQQSAEAALMEQRNYQVLFETLPMAAFTYDPSSLRLVDANPATAELLGFPVHLLSGMSLDSFVPESDRAAFLAGFKTRDMAHPGASRQRVRNAQGQEHDLELHGRPVLSGGRQLRLVLARDVTEQTAAADALARSEALFRALVANASEALVLMNPDGRVAFASSSITNVIGFAPEERVGSHSSTLLHPDDQPQVWEIFKQCLADPSRTYTFESRIRHKDGHWVHTSAKLRNFLDDPAIGALALNYRDVSAERAATQALAESERFYRALIEAFNDIVLIYRSDGEVNFENPKTLAEKLGYSVADLKDQGPFSMIHPEDLAQTLRRIERAKQGATDLEPLELRLRSKDGRWLSFQSHAQNLLGNAVVRGLLVTLRDVTQMRAAQNQLLHLERLAAIGRAAAGLSHEIRNPLAIITSHLDLLDAQLEGRAALRDVEGMRRQVLRLNALVQEVLERSQGGELRLEEASANDLVGRALKAAQIRYGPAAERVDVGLDLASPGPRLLVDLPQMERVLTNLILNAYQAMRQGGALTLSTRADGGDVVFEVSDNGEVIPEANLARIFEPFFTTKDTGSGLGLWMCRAIVQDHGGTLGAENLHPRGCCFRVRLPLAGRSQA